MPSSPPPAPSRDLARITLSVLAIGVLMGGSLWVLRPFLSPLLWATMIVVATWPLMIRLQRRLGGRRGAAVAAMTGVLLLVLFVPLYLAVATLLEQSDRIADLAREFSTRRWPPPPLWVESVPLIGAKLSQRWLALSALEPAELSEKLLPYLRVGVGWFAAQAGSFAALLINFLLTVGIAAILYARGEAAAEHLRRFFRRLSPDRGDTVVELSGMAIRAVALGIVITAAAQSVLAGIGLFAVAIPFAGVLTALVFILCIAQLGPILAMLPGVIWLYATDSPGRGTVLLAVAIFAQVIDNVLRPLLIKKGGDLSLLLILPGVIGGLLWLGIIGLFVGPVILAVSSTLLQSWISSGLAEPAAESGKKTLPPREGATRGGDAALGHSP